MATASKRTSDTRAPESKSRHLAPKVQKVDRRVERTQRQLSDSLMALILERGWDAVTVRDVCEHANIGRSTFYLHYADKESLLLGGFDELHQHLAELTRDAKRPFAFAEALLEHALGNERLFRAMVGRQSWQQMQWRFRDLVVTLLLAELAALKVPAASRPATARFIAGGFLEHLMEALENPGKTQPSELAARFRVLALGVASAAREF